MLPEELIWITETDLWGAVWRKSLNATDTDSLGGGKSALVIGFLVKTHFDIPLDYS